MSVIEIPDHLTSECSRVDPFCRNLNCPNAVKVNAATGRAFITMGHAGFNGATNNGRGYTTTGGAWRAMARLLGWTPR